MLGAVLAPVLRSRSISLVRFAIDCLAGKAARRTLIGKLVFGSCASWRAPSPHPLASRAAAVNAIAARVAGKVWLARAAPRGPASRGTTGKTGHPLTIRATIPAVIAGRHGPQSSRQAVKR